MSHGENFNQLVRYLVIRRVTVNISSTFLDRKTALGGHVSFNVRRLCVHFMHNYI